jgi:hypothetical protein
VQVLTADHDLQVHQNLVKTVETLNAEVSALQNQERDDVQQLHAMLQDAQRRLDEAEWHKNHMLEENEWLKAQLGSLQQGQGAAAPLGASIDSDYPGADIPQAGSAAGAAGAAGAVDGGAPSGVDPVGGAAAEVSARNSAVRDSLNVHSGTEIGITSLTLALSKMGVPLAHLVPSGAPDGQAAVPAANGEATLQGRAEGRQSGVEEEHVVQVCWHDIRMIYC